MRFRGRPAVVWILLAVIGQLSVRALLGGGALVLAPSGSLVGLSTGELGGTPFGDFLIPGSILLVVFGLCPVWVIHALYARRWWGWLGASALATALLGWLLVEVAFGFARPTLYVNLGTAIAILVLAMHPEIRHGGSGNEETS